MNQKKPPIVAILFLVVFLMGVLYFVASQQLENSKAHRLRLLAGFSSRVEATVPDLAKRFERIAQTTSQQPKSAEETQRPESPSDVERYVEQIPNLTYLSDRERDLETSEKLSPRDLPALEIKPLGPDVYLVFRDWSATCSEPPAPCRKVREVKAKLDLATLLEPAVLPETFDSILLAEASEEGAVLFQQGEQELRLTSLGAVRSVEPGGDEDAQGGRLQSLLGSDRWDIGSRGLSQTPSTGSLPIEVAEVEYRFFFQPVVLELPALKEEGSQPPIHWIAGGFVARDRLLSASFTSSPILLFALLAIFPLGVLAWPFLKLWLISSRQRMTRLDVGFLVISSMVGCFLLTLLVLDLAFWHQMRQEVDSQLGDLAAKLEHNFERELGHAFDQLESFHGSLEKFKATTGTQAEQEGDFGTSPTCEPAPPSLYPILHSVFWVNSAGDQEVKMAFREHSRRKSRVQDREYFQCAVGEIAPYRVKLPEREQEVELCLQSVISNTGGADQAILAIPKSREDPESTEGDGEELQPILATQLASLTQAVLPQTYGFAVVDATQSGSAEVLFHSDSRRILSEDLLKASDEDALLASMLETRREGPLTLRYWGQRYRAHVTHLEGFPWALVTYRTTQDLRMRNLELFYDIANPAVLYFGILLLLLLLLRNRLFVQVSLWPHAPKNKLYSWIVVLSILVLSVYCLAFGWAERSLAPRSLFLALLTLFGLPLAVGLGFVVLWLKDCGQLYQRWPDSKRGWWHREVRRAHGRLTAWLREDRSGVERGLLLTSAVFAVLGLLLSPCLATLAMLLTVVSGTGIWFIFRNEFRQPSQQRRTYIFAMTCLLFLLSVVPAIGLFSLAQERQWTFLVQETQEALLPALIEERRQTVQSPEAKSAFFKAYDDELKEFRKGLLASIFATNAYESERSSRSLSESRGWPWSDGLSSFLSSRLVPVNDLSARPRGVDVSRFRTPAGSWYWDRPGPSSGAIKAGDEADSDNTDSERDARPALARQLVGELYPASDQAIQWNLQSTVPRGGFGRLHGDFGPLMIPIFLLLILIAVWLASPYLAIRWIADRVLLAQLAPVRRELFLGGEWESKVETSNQESDDARSELA
ncbi:MAG: hypothetical protein SX243_12255 [Acidobacteriota bacterium]|nr:hypothetical protein [Acidobacteriota bacterium]